MLKRIFLVSACLVASIMAQDEEDVKADSVVYEKPTEWQIFSADAPVTAFTVQGNLLWYATEQSVFSSSLTSKDIRNYSTLGKIPGSNVTSMTTDNKGSVWFGSQNGVAVRTGNSFTCYTTENGIPDNSVNALLATTDGKIWIGTNNGAAVFQNGEWKTYTTKEGLAHNKVNSLLADKDGVIWFGTEKGISVFDGASWKVHDMKSGLSWNSVKALAKDPRKGTIWAAVGEKDVNCYTNGKWNTYMDIMPDIRDIMVDTQSRIWFGSTTGYIKFNGDEWVSDPKKNGVPAAQVRKMNRDKNGNLWFAIETGVLRLSNPYPF
ncbi:MAG: hypothetical protein GXY77_09205 [Fibrobacter sp.]|nr:hypothetical protein [Fibrobacter sp.]